MLTLHLMPSFKTGANICNNLNQSLRKGVGKQKAGRGLGLVFWSALSPQAPPMWALTFPVFVLNQPEPRCLLGVEIIQLFIAH